MNIKQTYTLLLAICLLIGCSKKDGTDVDLEKTPVATVNNQTLYQSDIDQLLKGTAKADSARIVSSYINLWISDLLMYEKAQNNVSEDEEIKTLLKEYRKSLIVNKYQNQLLAEKLSKEPNDAEFRRFYENNKKLFTLKEEIIKGLFLKVPTQSSELPNLKKWYKQNTDDALRNLESKILQNTVAYENFHDTWINFHDVLDNIPVNLDDHPKFLKGNKNMEVSDSTFVYLLYISDYLLDGEPAPYDYIKDRVKMAYIEHQRDNFINELNQDLYNNAEDKGKITFHNKK